MNQSTKSVYTQRHVPYHESYAMVVGWPYYLEPGELPFVPFDVVQVALSLMDHGFQIVEVTTRGPTTSDSMDNLLQRIGDIRPKLPARARIVSAFLGHAADRTGDLLLNTFPEKPRRPSQKMPPRKQKSQKLYPLKTLASKVYEWQGLQAYPRFRHAGLWLDICHGGHITQVPFEDQYFAELLKRVGQPSWTLEFLAASNFNQDAEDRGGGLMSAELIRMLRGASEYQPDHAPSTDERTYCIDLEQAQNTIDERLGKTKGLKGTQTIQYYPRENSHQRLPGEPEEDISPDYHSMLFKWVWADVDCPQTLQSNTPEVTIDELRQYQQVLRRDTDLGEQLSDALLGLPVHIYRCIENQLARWKERRLLEDSRVQLAAREIRNASKSYLLSAIQCNPSSTTKAKEEIESAVNRLMKALSKEKGQQLWHLLGSLKAVPLGTKETRGLLNRLDDVAQQLVYPWEPPPRALQDCIRQRVERVLTNPTDYRPPLIVAATDILRYLDRRVLSTSLDKELKAVRKRHSEDVERDHPARGRLRVDVGGHEVFVMKSPVTMRQYCHWGGKPSEYTNSRVDRTEDDPITGISLAEAADFCVLEGGRLLTPGEWDSMFNDHDQADELKKHSRDVLEWTATPDQWKAYIPGKLSTEGAGGSVCGDISQGVEYSPVKVCAPEEYGNDAIGFRVAWDIEQDCHQQPTPKRV